MLWHQPVVLLLTPLIFLCSLAFGVKSQRVDMGPEFEPVHSTSLAVVLYNEDNLHPHQLKERQFQFKDHSIVIKQNWQGVGVAAVVWDAAYVLGEYLSSHPGLLADKAAIELGAGTGLVGIVAAKLGADVTITDRTSALEGLQENIEANFDGDSDLHVHIKELSWGHRLGDYKKPFDIILGADIIYIDMQRVKIG